jgi:hypothetical protein
MDICLFSVFPNLSYRFNITPINSNKLLCKYKQTQVYMKRQKIQNSQQNIDEEQSRSNNKHYPTSRLTVKQ